MKRYTRLFIVLGLAIIGVSFVIYLNIPHTTAVSDVTTSPLTVSTAKSGQISQATPVQAVPQPPTVSELLILINVERAKVGVKPLVIDERLNQSAQYKADDELSRNYFGHYDPVTGKANGLAKIEQLTGKLCTYVSENLVWNKDKSTMSSSEAISWWMGSTPHRTALLDSKYTLTGFGINKYVIVEHFCQQ
jgi:uncharacterized protein YkwD